MNNDWMLAMPFVITGASIIVAAVMNWAASRSTGDTSSGPPRPCPCCKSLRCDVARAVATSVSYDRI